MTHDIVTSLGISDEQWNDKLQQASVVGRRVFLPLCVLAVGGVSVQP